ncbi:MAG: GNAT family N-acetyltransferase, partial [Bdellovibrionales bacterium]
MSPLRITFPQVIPTLNSERLVLKPITDADADAYFSICSNPVVMRPWGTKCHESMDETRDLIQYLEQEFKHHRMIRWGVFEGGGSTLIGDVGFWRFVFPRARAEIGAKLDPHVWNRGYMTEAMITVLDFGFRGMNLNSIEGNVDPEN